MKKSFEEGKAIKHSMGVYSQVMTDRAFGRINERKSRTMAHFGFEVVSKRQQNSFFEFNKTVVAGKFREVTFPMNKDKPQIKRLKSSVAFDMKGDIGIHCTK